MSNRVLVTYATKYGSTAEIAVKIATVIRDSGIETDIIPIENVTEVFPYQAVIIGSAVYMGQWRKEMVNFLKEKQIILSEKPVWIFSSGPTGEGNPVDLMKGWQFPEKLEPIVDVIQPRDTIVFHGRLNLNTLTIFERWIAQNVKSPVGDFRDWKMIVAWANTIAYEIKVPEFV